MTLSGYDALWVMWAPRQSAGVALHSCDAVGLIMKHLKRIIKINTAEPEMFLLKTSCLHYPQCSLTNCNLSDFIVELYFN